jgi:hypothetical protein
VLDGSASYSGQTTGPAGASTQLYGATPAAVTVDDFTIADSCSGNPVEFTVRVGDQCVLWALATDYSGSAGIEAAQTCGVPTAQGIVTIDVDQGTLSTNSPASLTLSGAIRSSDVLGATGGYLQWSFSGS